MASSIQQIEAALAYVQLPSPRRSGQALETARRVESVMASCSFDIDGEALQQRQRQPEVGPLSQVRPPQFCKPLRRIGVQPVRAVAPRPQPVSMVVRPAIALKPEIAPTSVSGSVPVANPTPIPTQTQNQTPAPSPAVKPIQEYEPPDLPRAKSPQFSSHRNNTNPMLPLSLLQDIAKEVVLWQTQLKQVHDSIHELYAEGPIVNAWLEAVEGAQQATTEAISAPVATPTPQLTMAGRYCVCGFDRSGQIWRKLCPQEQLPQVSLAIARHQQLRQLLNRKQALDNRLQRLAQTLTVLRGRLRAY